jgi:hypothetical protein
LSGNLSACKVEEEIGLTPADDENAVWRKINRKDICFLMEEQHKGIAEGRLV